MKKLFGLLILSLMVTPCLHTSIVAGTQETDLNIGIADPLTNYNVTNNNPPITNSIGWKCGAWNRRGISLDGFDPEPQL